MAGVSDAERTVVVIEDDPNIADLVNLYLREAGFRVLLADAGRRGLELVEQQRPALAVLDIGLPDIDGFEVCRRIRATSSLPVLFLTARDGEIDRVLGLELGADDYVTKPFSSRELVARVRAVLRRQSAIEDVDPGSSELKSGPVVMDVDRHIVTVEGKEVKLPLKEFELLELLLRNAGRVLTRTQLIDRIWGSNYVGDTKTLDVHVKRIRSKIEPDPANPRYLETVRGLGYKFN